MYTPLKVTTEYTLLKSLIKVSDLISFLIANNIKSCAICDENLYGCLDFYNACIANHIKPIIGLSVKINDFDKFNYDLKNFDIIVDAILGTGFKGDLKDNVKNAVDKINESNVPVVAVDIPNHSHIFSNVPL